MNDVYKIAIKLVVQHDTFSPDAFVPIFHRWIQNESVPGHLLIDVADYEHVHAGPGTVLIAHEANLGMDRGNNQLGLLYVRKQPIADATTLADRLRAAMSATLHAAAQLEQEPELAGRLTFRTDQISIRFNDRLLTPNTPDAFESVKPAIDQLIGELFPGASSRVEQVKPGSQQLLEALITGTPLVPVATLLSHASV